MNRVYLGLGANLGDPNKTLREAITVLRQQAELAQLEYSSFYRSKPMGPADQPDYVNAVVRIETALSPFQLLSLVQQIEYQFGRQRQRRWGERSLDIDILLYGNTIISDERLHIPHLGLCQRDFVVVPLLELDTSLCLPDGRPLTQVWQQLQATQPGHDLVKIS
jgi:2-amino-4-hydroxy-6-hydroxymethyldihydropteridine diphosphokinase